MSEQALYIVATPIGNLEDLSPRAVATLSSVGLIAAEDTRHSQRLLSHFNIRTPVWAVHDHNERKQADAIVQRLMGGESVALVSDAGTPLISDPGYHLVKEVRRAGFKVVPIPGPCAMVTALCAAGLPTDKFVFEGFLPARAQARQAALEKVRDEARTLVFYESPHRILATLQAMVEVFGEGRAMVMARELTKTFETFLSGSIAEVLAEVEADHNQQKGEMVLMVQGHSVPVADDDDLDAEGGRVMQILLESLSISQAASTGAKILNQPRKKLYQWALARQND
ncbi:16S rRNA (cytidine(1402)-2'-O)-methyltransferase [Pokkaliibacter sp. MBI-7]|uniref:16S rRNA (cytidine(1402)-2'-O)-methyltransferase n=1 Tax=Pokkaliibacter sp. MBI-7 TaxID=3040600 RepID=UPI00244B5EE5|nr:16S rRNA (cytidine(1402)-2'-O)-methyltransferase [Pokkaliibacter sp. MBI-7]MDH2431633.1 16S rRNA (cytidine(1402)-2'-O)-methyltransferase [Pokkaliibacter sp. MBI-7]